MLSEFKGKLSAGNLLSFLWGTALLLTVLGRPQSLFWVLTPWLGWLVVLLAPVPVAALVVQATQRLRSAGPNRWKAAAVSVGACIIFIVLWLNVSVSYIVVPTVLPVGDRGALSLSIEEARKELRRVLTECQRLE